MPYVQRDQSGRIVGRFAQAQEGYAEEFVADDAPEILALAAADDRLAGRMQIDADREAALLAGVSWNGRTWHIDQTFQLHITGLITAHQAGLVPAAATQAVRTKDNEIVQLGLAELKQLAGAVMARVQEVWAASWAAKDALE